ncbi:BglG family transcription antiterminator [Symbiobacterium thermophilum]|uniref:BglG family transcription antiterminator n=1 Tax=Symbiobacterium thermophilum TaxID=2734 RepID=UPI0035C6E01D
MSTNRDLSLRPLKALNNNVLLAYDPACGQEVVVVGRGLGFRVSGPIRPDDPRIEKVFRLDESRNRKRFLRLTETLSGDVIGVAEEILNLAAARFGPLGEEAHLTLAEHLAATVDRVRKGMPIPNPFLAQIQLLYPEEYALAGQAVEMIASRLGGTLPEEEQGILALHLLGAWRRESPKVMARHQALIRESAAFLAAEAGISWSDDDPRLSRVLLHLRLAIDLIVSGKAETNPVLDRIRSEYPEEFARARRLGDYMAQRLERPVSDDEVGYLALHLLRLKNLTQ